MPARAASPHRSLGDVMKESVEAARTVVRSRARRAGIKDGCSRKDMHIHVPGRRHAQGRPRAPAHRDDHRIVSALTGIPVRGDVA